MTKNILSKKNSSATVPYAWGVGLLFIPESALVIVIARLWLDWTQIHWLVIPYIALAAFLLYHAFLAPARIPHLITNDGLVLTYGHLLRITIPLDYIESVTDTAIKNPSLMVPFGAERDKKTGILFIITGNSNKLLLQLEHPIQVKGFLRNFGYVDQFVINADEPVLLKQLASSEQISSDVAASSIKVDTPTVLPLGSAWVDTESQTLDFLGVTKRFHEVVAVQDLTFRLFPGELFGLLGSNGAGKTTTLKMISGLLKPNGGKINNYEHTIAYMPESTVPYERMTGREFLQFLSVLYGLDAGKAENQIQKFLVRFEMLKAADRVIGEYSQGMKRKITLIATLLKGSDIILLDEPTNGLDPGGIRQVKEVMRELTGQGKTVVFSTHILDMAEQLCDRVGIMAGGNLLFVGTLEELRETTKMDNVSLESIFLRLVQAG